ncbi:MAG TPA: hypothetical protein PLP73_04740, partial [Candidatus Absconditabacterales bacterium]|nr:hypothetical protein [Candidatus Absconditabacterales bacterium]
GVGTYHFFETQLLKKIFKISIEEKILHLVPSFGSVKNYTYLIKNNKSQYVFRQFGIVYFVSPKNTSFKCPICLKSGREYITRNDNIITCKSCGFVSGKDNDEILKKYTKTHLNIHFIKNGDDNGAYHIGKKLLK